MVIHVINLHYETATTVLLNEHRKSTLKITLYEASGYTMLGLFAVYFSNVLSGELNTSHSMKLLIMRNLGRTQALTLLLFC